MKRYSTSRSTTRFLAAGALALAASLTGCAAEDAVTPAAAPAATAAAATAAAPLETDGLTITDPWVKATDTGMTATFGTLVNSSDTEVTIESASSSVSMMELHEMAASDSGEMVMRPKEGGFVIPAGGTHVLEPGADHLMMMNVTAPVKPGDEVAVTLTAKDGSTYEFTAPARSFAGGNETYEEGDDSGMSMEPSMEPSMGSSPSPTAS